jgi:psiF repeat
MNMLTKSTVVAAIVFSLVIGGATAFAQNPPPATDQAAGGGAMDKKGISKACSDQANAKGLHGKARKKFRSECKLKGGKME